MVMTLAWFSNFQAHGFDLTDGQLQKLQVLPANTPGLKSSLPKLREHAKNNPKSASARIELARALLSTGNFTDGIDVLKTLNGDVEPRAHLLLDIAFETTEQFTEQARILELLRKKMPNSKYLLIRLGRAYLKTKNPKASVEVLKDCKKRFPEDRECYFELLNVYEESKNSYETRVLLTDMATLFKADANVFARLCKSYATNSFIDQGLDICERAIKLQPRLADSHVYYSLLKRYNKEPEVSEKLLKRAAVQFPKSELAQWNLGQLYMEQKNYESARRTYALCTKYNKQSDRCWLGTATAVFELKDHESALSAFTEACKLNVKTRTPFRAAITQLRIQNFMEMSAKYSAEFDKCGLNAATE